MIQKEQFMKKQFVFILTAIMLCLCFVLSACGEAGGNRSESGDDGTYYTVTFDSRRGSAVESKRVLAGNPVSAPDSPTRENFNFNGWFRSINENAARWNFSTDRVNENLTLYAHWTEKQQTPAPSATLTFELSTAGTGYIVTGDKGQAANIVIPAEHDGVPVVGIGESAFAYSQHTSNILSVTIPDSVTGIGRNAFHNQKALVSVNIGTDSKLESIGSNAFSGCSALTNFYLPTGCNLLGYDATPASFADEDSEFIDSYGEVFNGCGALENFTVAEGNSAFASRGGHLVCIGGKHNSAGGVILVRGVNAPEIPSGVTAIGKAAFRGATIAALYIPASVTKIGNYFADKSAITAIYYAGSSEVWSSVEKPRMWGNGADFNVVCDTAFHDATTGNT